MCVYVIDHRVDRVLQLEDFALHIDRDFPGQVAARHRSRDLRDVAHLSRQIAGHRIDRVRQILPGAGDTRDLRLTAEPPFGADLTGNAGHLAGEAVQLVDHRVQRFLQLKDLAAHVDGDLAGQVAIGDRRRDLGDVAYLTGQVAGHRVDVVGQILPGSGDARHHRLPAEPAFGADLSRDTCDLAGK